MALTLIDGARLSNDVLVEGVIETVINDSPILQRLPFIEIVGNGLSYNRENKLTTTAANADRRGSARQCERGRDRAMDLAQMRARVRVDLHDEDTNEERWSDATLDRHIARALRELSLAAPRELVTTLSTVAASRDLNIATLTDRVAVDAVEYPVDANPPIFVPFSVWGDTMTLEIERRPSAAESVRVRYTAMHQLDATISTVPQRLEDLVATGATAYAALEWASYATNRINAGGDDVWRHYHSWGQERLTAFIKDVAQHGRNRRVRVQQLYPSAAIRGSR